MIDGIGRGVREASDMLVPDVETTNLSKLLDHRYL